VDDGLPPEPVVTEVRPWPAQQCDLPPTIAVDKFSFDCLHVSSVVVAAASRSYCVHELCVL
jgi:hypothetical protein